MKGNERLEGSFQVALDRRAPYGIADRTAQLELALQVEGLFEKMSSTVDRLEALRRGAEARAGALPAGDPLAAQLRGLTVRAEEIRGRIVATREGGAITGEERLRENTDLLYGALLSWEGRPAVTLVERTSALERELGDVTGDLDRLIAGTLPGLDRELGAWLARSPPRRSLPRSPGLQLRAGRRVLHLRRSAGVPGGEATLAAPPVAVSCREASRPRPPTPCRGCGRRR